MLKLLAKVLCILVLMAACATGWAAWEAKRFLETPPATPGQEVYFDVTPGANLARIARQLEEKGIVADEFKFRLLARWKKQSATPIVPARNAQIAAAKNTARIDTRPSCTWGVVRIAPGTSSTPLRSSPHVLSRFTVAWNSIPAASPHHQRA